MKIVRFIFGFVGFLVVWLTIAALITFVIHLVFPHAGGEFAGVPWTTIPGTVLGALVGYRVYRLISRDHPRKASR